MLSRVGRQLTGQSDEGSTGTNGQEQLPRSGFVQRLWH